MKGLKIFTLILAATLMAACSDDDNKPDTGDGIVNVNRNDISKEPALQRLEFRR